jgi:hypothetical protein
MPVLSYTGGVIEWTQSEVEKLDRKKQENTEHVQGPAPKI